MKAIRIGAGNNARVGALMTKRLLPRLRPMAVAIALGFSANTALSLPSGPQVVSGTATMAQTGGVLTVQNSNNAILNWQQFGIAASETVKFLQPSASSSVLNRVVGPDPSAIHGQLLSNGRVFLINPNGIMIGPGGRIDTAGFVASTLNVANQDFLAGRLNFQATPGAGSVVNQGSIVTPEGGTVYLVGADVTNGGLISTPNGETLLAAGQTVNLIDTATPGVKVEITGAAGNVTNLGEITATAGRIGMAGVLVKNAGALNASSVVREGGRIFLSASKDVVVDGQAQIRATGSKGGSIAVLGEHVAVADQASLDASGAAGGGTILVGGDLRGANAAVRNASIAYFGPAASLRADATSRGDGGKVVLWSDDSTYAHGSISARGGALGGDGGLVETSGHRFLDFTGNVDTRAPLGAAGTLLLDPANITINATIDNLAGGGFNNGVFSSAASNSAVITWNTLNTQLANGNVVITTSGNGGEGNITIGAPATVSTPNRLSLLAQGNLALNSSITNSGSGSVVLVAGWDGNSTAAPTASASVGSLTFNSAGKVTTSGGNIDLLAGQDITLSGGYFNVLGSGGGDIKLQVLGAGGVNISAPSGTTYIAPGSGTLSVIAGSGGMNLPGYGQALSITSSSAGNGFSVDTLNLGSGGSLAFDGIATVGTLNMSGSSISNASGSSQWNVTNAFNWSGGGLSGVGSNHVVVDVGSSATLAITGTNTPYSHHGAVINNAGNASLAGGNLSIGDGGSHFNNLAGATFTITDDSGITGCAGCGTGQGFFNSGSFIKDGGTGVSVIGSGGAGYQEFNNSGSVTVKTGTLQVVTGGTDTGSYAVAAGATLDFNAGTRSFNSGSALTAAGALKMTGASISANSGSTFSLADLTLSGGILQGSDHISISGAFDWSGGTIQGSGNLDTSGTTTLNPASPVTLAGSRVWNNSGTVNHGGGSYLSLSSGTPVINNLAGATWNEASTHGSYAMYYGTFNNAGTFNKTGTSTTQLYGTLFTNTATGTDAVKVSAGTLLLNPSAATNDSGNYAIAGGAKLEFGGGGTRNWNAGIAFSGSGNVLLSGGTTNVAASVATPATLAVTMTGGTLTGSGDLTLGGAFDWSDGTISGSGALNTSGTTTLSGSGSKYLQDKTWTNTGTMNLTGGYLYFYDTGTAGVPVFTNAAGGVVTMSSTHSNPFAGNGTFNNAGTLNWNAIYANYGYSDIDVAFNNSGTVNVNDHLRLTGSGTDSGAYVLAGGKSLEFTNNRTLNSGASFTSSGAATVALTNGTLTLNAQPTFGSTVTLAMSGGTLTSPVAIDLSNPFIWSDGTISGSGALNTSGTTTLSGTGSKYLQDKTWTNTGTLNLTGGYLYFYDTGTTGVPVFTNAAGGVVTMSSTHSNPFAGNGTFNNAGTLNWNAIYANYGYSDIDVAFNNSGTVNVNDHLRLTGSGTDSGAYVLAGGKSLEFTNSRTLNSGASFTSSGAANVALTNGTLTLNAQPTFGNTVTLAMSGGTLTSPVAIDLSNPFIWSDGTISGSGALNTSGTTTLSGTGSKYLQDKTWTNSGTLNLTGGYLYFYDTGTTGVPVFTNAAGGVVTMSSTHNSPFTGNGTFNNAGTLNWNAIYANYGYSDIDVAFNNSGTVNVNDHLRLTNVGTDSGAYVLADGKSLEFTNNRTLNSGASFTSGGAANVKLTGGTLTLAAQPSFGNTVTLAMSSGTLTSPVAIDLSNPFIWSGGTIGGSGALTTSGITTLSGTGSKYLQDKTWINTGTVNLTGGYLYFYDTGTTGVPVFNNAAGGVVTMSSTHSNPFAGNGTFNNAGTLNWNAIYANYGYSDIDVAFNNSGTVNVNDHLRLTNGGTDTGTYSVAAGKSLFLAGGTRSLDAGSNIGGAGTLAVNGATVNVNGALDISTTGTALNVSGGSLTLNNAVTAGTVNFSGGTIGGTGGLSITGAFGWSGGTLSGSGTLNTSGTTTLSGTGSKYLQDKTWINTGTVNLTGGYFYFYDTGTAGAPVFTNAAGGVVTMSATDSNSPFYGNGTFNNAGTLNWNASYAYYGYSDIDVAFNNSGTVNVNDHLRLTNGGTDTGTYNVAAGKSLFLAGGTRNLDTGSNIGGAGTLAVNGGTLNINTAVAAGTVSLSGGTLGGTGNLTVSGAFDWSGGTATGSGALITSGTTTLSGTGGKYLQNKTWTNSGTVNLTGGYLYFYDTGTAGASVFTNAAGGVVTMTSTHNSPFYGNGTFNNAGTLNWNATYDYYGYSDIDPTFSNSGTVNVTVGTLRATGSFASNAGTINLDSGTAFRKTGGFINTGTLSGFGTFDVGAGNTLINEGVIRPGGSAKAGTLSIAGHFSNSAGGIIEAEIGGTAAGSDHDVLAVSGNVTLGGTLRSTLLGGFAPSYQSFDIVTAGGTASGSFATFILPSGLNSAIVGSAYRLSHSDIVCNGGVCWDGGAGTVNWTDPANWTGDSLPGTGDIAFLNHVAGITVNLANSSESIKGMNSDANNHLTIGPNGVLTLNDPATTSNLSGNLTLAGGSLVVNGTVNAANLTISGGTLSGSGGLTVSGSTAWTGGSIALAAFATHGATTLDFCTNCVAQLSGIWNNHGSIDFTGGRFQIDSPGEFNNQSGATFNWAAPTIYEDIQGNGTFNNRAGGTFNASRAAGADLNVIQSLTLNNAGQMNVQNDLMFSDSTVFKNSGAVALAGNVTLTSVGGASGVHGGVFNLPAGAALRFAGYGSHDFNAGSNVTGAGSVTVSAGTVTVNAGYDIAGSGTTTIDGGALVLNVPLTFANTVTLTGMSGRLNGSGDLVMNGEFNWSGNADTSGSGTLTTQGTTHIDGYGNYANRHWINLGVVNLASGNTDFELPPGSVFDNRGTFNMNSGKSNPVASLWGGAATFKNSGQINWNGSSFQQIDAPIAFTNTGTVNIKSGTLSVAGTLAQAGGIYVAADASLRKYGGFTNVGTLEGFGTVDVGSGYTLTNSGTIRPGGAGSAGTLSIAGNFSNDSAGVIEAEIGGTQAGSGHDVLAVSGSVSLGGTLDMPLLADFIPAGQSFDVVTAGSGGTASGSFSTLTLPSGVNGAIVGNVYRLTHTGIVCGGRCWDGGAGTVNWTDAANWTGDALPDSDDIAFLNLVAGVTVNLANSSQTIKGLDSSVGNNLVIGSGGTLTLADAATTSTLYGNVTLSGGTLNAQGALHIGGVTTLGSGTLNLANVADLTGNLVWNGGSITGSGTLNLAGELHQNTASATVLSGVTLIHSNTSGNSQLVNTSDSGFNIDGAAVFRNAPGAVLNLGGSAGPMYIDNDSGTGSRFENQGVLNKVGTAVVDIGSFGNLQFVNTGALNVAAGQLDVGRALSSADCPESCIVSPAVAYVAGMEAQLGGALDIAAAAKLRVRTGQVALSAPVVGAGVFAVEGGTLTLANGVSVAPAFAQSGGTVLANGMADFSQLALTGGTLSLNGETSVTDLNLSGGTLNGNGNVAVANAFDWSGGSLAGGGTLTTDGTSTLSGNATLALERAWFNNGTINFVGATQLSLGGGTTTFFATAADSLGPLDGGSVTRTIAAPAAAGAAELSFDLLGYNTVDGINCCTDTFELTINGTKVFSGGFDMGGGGSSFTNLQDPSVAVVSSQSFGIGSGGLTQFKVTPTLQAGTNTFVFAYSAMQGLGDEGWGLRNMVVTAPFSGAASLNNQPGGIVNLGSTHAMPITANVAGAAFNNAGTLNKTSAGSASIGGGVTFANTGTINVANGVLTVDAAFAANAGTIHVASGTVFGKAGNFTNTGVISGAGTIDVGSGNTLANEGIVRPGGGGAAGTLAVSGNFSNAATGTIEAEIGGTAAGTQYDVLAVSGDVTLGGTLNGTLQGGFAPAYQSFDIVTAGGNASGSFATLNLPTSFNGAIVGNVFRLTHSDVNCTGICWDGGAGTLNWTDAANWSGDVLPGNADTAFLSHVAGITVNLANSSQSIRSMDSTASNDLVIGPDGVLTLNDPAATSTLAGNLTLAGGTLIANGTLDAANLSFSGGTLAGSGKVTITGAADIGGGRLSGSGKFITQGSSTLAGNPLLDGKTWRNEGTLSIGGDHGILFANAATLENAVGGTINLASSATVPFDYDQGAASSFVNAGTITGYGMIDVGSEGTLINDGLIAPGSTGSVGTLLVNGNFAQGKAGTLKFKLGGTGVGQSDKLAVSGNVALDGKIHADLINDYLPAVGDAVSVLTMGGAATGSFTSSNVPAGFTPGYNLYSAEAARLVYADPGHKFFNNSRHNLDWGTADNWSGGLPTATDHVLIDSGFTLNHAYGSDTIGALTIAGGNGLAVSGGSLAVLGQTALGGALVLSAAGEVQLKGAVGGTGAIDVQGGKLTLDGATAIATLRMSGGALAGPGSLAVTSSFSKTGGTFTPGGPVSITQSSGDIDFVSDAAILLGTLTADHGSIIIVNTGGIASGSGLISAAGGVTLTAHSPISIGSGGLAAGSGIKLAAPTESGDSNITLNGPLASDGGNVDVSAYHHIHQNAAIVTGGGGGASVSSSSGNIVMGGDAQTTTAGGGIGYTAGGNIVLTRLDAGSGGVALNSGGSVKAASSGTNIIGSSANIVAGGEVTLTTKVQKLDVDVPDGVPFRITDATGTVFTDVKPAAPVEIVETITNAAKNAQESLTSPQNDTSANLAALAATAGSSGATQTAATTQTIGGEVGNFAARESPAQEPAPASVPAAPSDKAEGAEKPEAKPAAADKKDEEKKEDKKAADAEKKEDKPAAKKPVGKCSA